MIGSELRLFLEEGLGVHVGTRNGQLEPNGARALALKVENDGAHVVVYMAKTAAARLMADLRGNGHAAVCVARPTDDRACQVKGLFVSARPARADERDHIVGQWERFLANLAAIGIPRQPAANWDTWPAVAIRLRATAVFDQTPGPSAGAPLS
jgi:hypothetical protein